MFLQHLVPIGPMIWRKTMINYHFKYEGEDMITADSYEEAEEQLKRMLRGVFTYRRIHHSVGMLAEHLYEDEE